ncbi:MAG TPA: hypothetical protein VGK27_07350 [Candidatus Deferrimicrobiaceae bacterium]|jgi:hypothetical protein
MRKDKKHKNKAPNSLLLKYKNKLRGLKKPILVLSDARIILGQSTYPELISWVRSNPILRPLVFHKDFPRSLKELKGIAPLYRINFGSELRWACVYLNIYVSEIKGFLALSLEYQQSFLNSDYEKCLEILNGIEKTYGQSIWLIKTKLNLLDITGGLESQKKYFRLIKDTAIKNGTAQYIAYYVSIRNESTITTNRFSSIFKNHTSKMSMPKDTYVYLKYHIDPDIDYDKEDLSDILRNECAGSIIDYYEGFVRVIQVLIHKGYLEELNCIKNMVLRFAADINDSRMLRLLQSIFKIPIRDEHKYDKYVDALNQFYKGNIELSTDLLKDNVELHPDLFENIELLSKIFSIENINVDNIKKCLLQEISIRMASVINNSNTFEDDVSYLSKIAINNFHFQWAFGLSNYLGIETSSDYINGDRYITFPLINYAFTHPLLNPFRMLSLGGKSDIANMIDMYKDNYGINSALGCVECLNEGVYSEDIAIGLRDEEKCLLEAEIMRINSKWSNIDEVLSKLELSKYRFYNNKAIVITIARYILNGELEECIRFITAKYINDASVRHIIPITTIADMVTKDIRGRMKNDISLSIFYDLYSKYIDNKYDSLRAFAYEDFLLSNGISRPSEINKIVDKFDREKIYYFLKYLCIEPIMDNSIVFSGSTDVAEERLAVCKFLIENKVDGYELHEDEIKNILKRLTIQKRMREVEQSKIYVDIEGIRKHVTKSMKEIYIRYISFLAHGIKSDNNSIAEESKIILPDLLSNSGISFPTPTNEAYEIFENMIIELRDAFISSTEYGLDGYLSVRIRHGTLSGQLRRHLESANLITRIDNNTGKYRRNEYWINKLHIEGDQLLSEFDTAFEEYSKGFDKLISDINNNWIQVKKSPEEKGLFDFSLYKTDTMQLATLITSDTAFDDFLEIIFNFFNSLLMTNLSEIRKVIDTNGKSQVNNLFDSLMTKIDSHDNVINIGDLRNTIRTTMTDMQLVMDRIKEWFRLSKISANDPFLIEDAINIGEESVKMYSTNFNVHIATNEDMPKIHFKGKLLTSFVDILFIIFENIVRHSGLLDRPEAFVTVFYDKGVINIEIENEIGKTINIRETNVKINAIKEVMREGNYGKSISSEGGTGFHKIGKILTHDFRSNQKKLEYDFGIRENDRFFVKFQIYGVEVPIEDFTS